MSQSNDHVPYALAIGAGAILWTIGSVVSDRREAWDSGLYWMIFYPAAIAACGFHGYLFPERPAIGVAKVTSGMRRKRDA